MLLKTSPESSDNNRDGSTLILIVPSINGTIQVNSFSQA